MNAISQTMPRAIVDRPDTSQTRTRLRLGAGVGALALVALAQPAFAADECGAAPAGGTVTCAAGSFATGITYTAPTGPLIVNLNPATAIVANAGVPAVTVTSTEAATVNAPAGATITTNGATGVNIATTGTGNATLTGGAITTTGANAGGALVTSVNGTASATPVSVTTSGATSDALTVTSTGSTATAGATTINATGTGSRGIVATGQTGTTVNYGSVTSNGAGVVATSPAGATSVTGTGNLSTTGVAADGIVATAATGATVTARNVTATGRGIVATGGTTASVTSTGVVANGDAVTATGGTGAATATLSGTNTSATGNGAVVTGGTTAGLTLTGGSLTGGTGSNGAVLTSTTGATVNNSGTISGPNAAILVNGAGAANITNNAAGTINGRVLLGAGNDTLTNAGTFNATAVSDFGAGNDTVNNSGTFNAGASTTFGAGTDVFNNTGTLRVLPNAAAVGTVTLTGLETFNNAGSVDLRNGRAGDVLVLPGTYTGTGSAALGLDVSLAAPATSDRLQVTGAATGSTAISINRIDAGPVVLSATGPTLVQAGAGTSATAFVIDPISANQGLIQYGVAFNPATSTFALVTTPGAAVYRTALFAQGTRNLWLQSGDAWSAHMRELRDNVAANGPGGAGGRAWFQGYGQFERRQTGQAVSFNGLTSQVDMSYDQDYFGFQLGMDLGAPVDDTGGFNFGVTAGYQNSEMRFSNTADRIRFNVVNGGVYASFAGGPFFVNALGKYDYYWGDNLSTAGNYAQDISGSVYGGKIEAGLRFGTNTFIEPSVSLSYTHSDFDDFAVPSGTFSFDDDEGLRGKAGARFGYVTEMGSAKVTLYGGANYVREFQGRDRATFVSGGQTVSFLNVRNRDYGEGTIGVNVGSEQGKISGFLEARYADGGDYMGYGARGGMRLRF